MGLRDELELTQPPKCQIALLMMQLDPAIAAELKELIDDFTIAGSAIGKLSTKKGWNLTATSVNRHRRQECRCR